MSVGRTKSYALAKLLLVAIIVTLFMRAKRRTDNARDTLREELAVVTAAEEPPVASVMTKEMAGLDEDVLFFSRVPKTGSEMMVRLLFRLAERNNFTHVRYGAPQPRKLPEKDQVMRVCTVWLPSDGRTVINYYTV